MVSGNTYIFFEEVKGSADSSGGKISVCKETTREGVQMSFLFRPGRGFGCSVAVTALLITCANEDTSPTWVDQNGSIRQYSVSCSAGCTSMNWSIVGESGYGLQEEGCQKTFIDKTYSQYTEVCQGTITFDATGHSYSYSVLFDWPNCKIEVTVDGVGSCTDQVGLKKSNANCGCIHQTAANSFVKTKEAW